MYVGSAPDRSYSPYGYGYGYGSVTGPGAGFGGGRPADPVGDLLGMNRDELALQRQQGFSLNDIAISKGISRDDLLGAIQAGMPYRARNAPDAVARAGQLADAVGPAPDPAAAQRMDTWQPGPADASGTGASGAADGGFGGFGGYDRHVGRHGRDRLTGPGSGDGTAPGAGPVGDLLGMNRDELALQRQQGFSLNDIAISKGISRDDLLGAIQAGMPYRARNAPDAAARAGQLADAVPTDAVPTDAVLSDAVLAGAEPTGTEPPDAGPDPLTEGATATDGTGATDGTAGSAGTAGAAPDPMAAVGTLLGMAPDELSLQLQQGFALNDIAFSKAIDHGDLLGAIQAGFTDPTLNPTDSLALAEQIAATPGTPPPDPAP